MIEPLLLFLLGMAVLLYGADKVVDAGSELALYYGVSTFFVGVTVISIGTSIPEITTSVFSAVYGAGDIVVGNIIGSETAQITLAIGIVALIGTITASRRNVMVYGGGMVVAMVIMMLTLTDGIVMRSEGVLMMLTYVFFIYHLYTTEGGEEVMEELDGRERPEKAVPWIVAGIIMVIAGGHLMVSYGIELAQLFDIPQYLIGFLTGLGTTIPEIAIAGLAVHRGRAGISAGSLFGSNITDPVFSLGAGAVVAEVSVADPGAVMASATYMLLVSLIVVGLFYWQEEVDRRTAILCILLYLPSFFVDTIVQLL